MIKIVLISHGPFCEGLLETLQMIAGPQKDVSTVALKEGESPDGYRDRLEETISANEKDYEGTLVLCDIKGGTPYNSAAFVSQKHQLSLVTGMNVPMAITVITSRTPESSLSELTELAVNEMSVGIEQVDLNFKGGKKRGKLSINKNR